MQKNVIQYGLTNDIYFDIEGYNDTVQFDICGVKAVGDNTDYSTRLTGMWTPANRLTVNGKDMFPNVFTDFGGQTIKVSSREVRCETFEDTL